jgi:hypothetical protein
VGEKSTAGSYPENITVWSIKQKNLVRRHIQKKSSAKGYPDSTHLYIHKKPTVRVFIQKKKKSGGLSRRKNPCGVLSRTKIPGEGLFRKKSPAGCYPEKHPCELSR